MKKRCIVLFLLLILASLFGCQSDNGLISANLTITKISVSNSLGFGGVNSDFFVEFKDEKTIEVVEKTLTNAKQEAYEVNISAPEYDVEVLYENGEKQGLHLWLGEEKKTSILMKVEKTNTVYTISKEMTKVLLELVE